MDQKPEDSGAGAAGGHDDDEISLIDLTLVLARRWKLLVFAPLIVGVVTLGLTFLMPLTYTASVQLMPPQQQSGMASMVLSQLGGAAGALGGSLAGLKNPNDQWVGLLKSRTIADALIHRFQLRELYDVEYQFQARLALDGRTRIQSGKDNLIDIEVDDHSPERAAQLATAYGEELQKLTKSLAVTEAARRRLFFERQLADTRNALVKAEVALKEGGINLSVLKTQPDAAVTQLAQLQAAVASQEVKVSVMRGAMTENNPDFRNALLELSSLRDQLRRAEQDRPGEGRSNSAQYIERYREFKYYETLFELYARQYELARVDEANDGSLVQMVDRAEVPEYKSKPKRGLLALLATLGTFFFCLIYCFVNSAVQNSRRAPELAAKLDALRQALRWRVVG